MRAVPLQPCRRHGKKRKEDEPDAVISKPKQSGACSELISRHSGAELLRPAMTPPYDLSPMYSRMDPQLQSSQVSSTVLDSPISLYSQWNYSSPEVIPNTWSPKRSDWRMTPSSFATPVDPKFDWDSPSVQTDLISPGQIKIDPDSTTLTPGRITTPDMKTPSSPVGKFIDDLNDTSLSKVIEEKSLPASDQCLDKVVLSPNILEAPSPFSPPSPNAPTNLLPTSIPLNLENTATFSNNEDLSALNSQSSASPCLTNESQNKTTSEESFLKPQTPPPIKQEKCCLKASPERGNLLDHVKLESLTSGQQVELLYNNNNKLMENLNYTSGQWNQYGVAVKQEPSWLNPPCSAATMLEIPSHLNVPLSGQDNKNWQQSSVYSSNAKSYLRLNQDSPQLGYQVPTHIAYFIINPPYYCAIITIPPNVKCFCMLLF